MINYKYFTTRFVDPENDIGALRAEFPDCYFKGGKRKGEKGIFILKTLDNKEYGESIELDNGDEFWGPVSREAAIKEIAEHATEPLTRISVNLSTGQSLQIFPASAIPRKAVFRARQKQNDNEVYNVADEYGKLAYELYQISTTDELKTDNPLIFKFIELSLKRSYGLPIEVWDHLGIISYDDFDVLLMAGLGFDEEFLKKTLEESNQQ